MPNNTNEFSLGMRVRCHSEYDGNSRIVGETATIVGLENSYVSLDFDNNIRGHDCSGLCQEGHGWQVPRAIIAPIGAAKVVTNCICSCCKQKMPKYRMKKGTNGKYVCAQCTRIKDYSTRNNTQVHKRKTHNKTYGFEFEIIPKTSEDATAIMSYGYGFIPTSDCSLASGGIEYKTPIYQSLNGLRPILRTLIKHADFRHSSCGQHINIGDTKYLTPENMRIIKQNAEKIFGKLRQHMIDNAAATTRICGRNFTSYANTSGFCHGSWINLGHNNRIEFRISKCQNANQYFQLVCMWTEMIDCVIANFLSGYVPTRESIPRPNVVGRCDCDNCQAERARYEREIAALNGNSNHTNNLALMEKTSNMLVKIFDKYANGKAKCQRPERNRYTESGTKRANVA